MSQPAEVPLGELLTEVDTVDPFRDFGEREFTYVDLSAVDQQTKVISAPVRVRGVAAPSRAKQALKSGDIVVSTVRPNLNAVAQVGSELQGAIGSTGFSVLRPTEKLDRRYLFHWVRSPRFVAQMVRRATGASYPAVSDRIIRASRVWLVPLDEQRRIARILDAADALRMARRQALNRLDDLLGAVFTQMFGDVERNERGWLEGPISDFVAGVVGGRSFAGSPEEVDPGLRVLRVSAVTSGQFKASESRPGPERISATPRPLRGARRLAVQSREYCRPSWRCRARVLAPRQSGTPGQDLEVGLARPGRAVTGVRLPSLQDIGRTTPTPTMRDWHEWLDEEHFCREVARDARNSTPSG